MVITRPDQLPPPPPAAGRLDLTLAQHQQCSTQLLRTALSAQIKFNVLRKDVKDAFANGEYVLLYRPEGQTHLRGAGGCKNPWVHLVTCGPRSMLLTSSIVNSLAILRYRPKPDKMPLSTVHADVQATSSACHARMLLTTTKVLLISGPVARASSPQQHSRWYCWCSLCRCCCQCPPPPSITSTQCCSPCT